VTGHIVVTGAAGFIGSRLTDRLPADGHTVVGLDSFEDYYPRALKEANLEGGRANPAFTLHEANILELAAEAPPGGPEAGGVQGSALAALLRGCARVYHLAAQAGVRASWGSSFEVYTRNNVLATQQLLEACGAAGVPKVIYASSSSVYGDQDELPLREDMAPRPRSPYGVTKLVGMRKAKARAQRGSARSAGTTSRVRGPKALS
jgi:nucleoside-diphosphate-sugar epimerase